MPRQYVSVQFHKSDARRYTYHNDGEPVAVDDRVIVNTRKGPSTVRVADVSEARPNMDFETKPIVGKAPHPDDPKPDENPHDKNEERRLL